MSTSWYDPAPSRPAPTVRKRDKVEGIVTLLLLLGLLGLLAFGVAPDCTRAPGPTTSMSPP